jgi:hypothetical protein
VDPGGDRPAGRSDVASSRDLGAAAPRPRINPPGWFAGEQPHASAHRIQRNGADLVVVLHDDGTRLAVLDLTSGALTIDRHDRRSVIAGALVPWADRIVIPTLVRPLVVNGAPTTEYAVRPSAATTPSVIDPAIRAATPTGIPRPQTVRPTPQPTPTTTFLPTLPPGWRVLDVQGLDAPVVVGSGGVFAVVPTPRAEDTVIITRRGVRIDGRRSACLRTARDHALATSDALSERCGARILAEPVLAVTSGVLRVAHHPGDVAVVPVESLSRWLDRTGPRLTADAASAIGDLAR